MLDVGHCAREMLLLVKEMPDGSLHLKGLHEALAHYAVSETIRSQRY